MPWDFVSIILFLYIQQQWGIYIHPGEKVDTFTQLKEWIVVLMELAEMAKLVPWMKVETYLGLFLLGDCFWTLLKKQSFDFYDLMIRAVITEIFVYFYCYHVIYTFFCVYV